MASAIHPGSPGAQPWREAPTLGRMPLFLRPILGGCLPPAPLSSQALSWGSGSLGLTVLGGGKTYTAHSARGMGKWKREAGGACYPRAGEPSNP